MLQRLQVLALVDVAHLETDAGSVEVHLDHLKGLLHDRALFGGQSPLAALQVVLKRKAKVLASLLSAKIPNFESHVKIFGKGT